MKKIILISLASSVVVQIISALLNLTPTFFIVIGMLIFWCWCGLYGMNMENRDREDRGLEVLDWKENGFWVAGVSYPLALIIVDLAEREMYYTKYMLEDAAKLCGVKKISFQSPIIIEK